MDVRVPSGWQPVKNRWSLTWTRVLAGCIAATASAGTGAAQAEVRIVDLTLRAEVESALGIQPGYSIGRSDMARLRVVDVSDPSGDVRDLTGLEYAINLEHLNARGNRVTDLEPLADLQHLERIELDGNGVTDISPLTTNTGIGLGDQVYLVGNPLSSESIDGLIPELEARGVFVGYHDDHGDRVSSATPLTVGVAASGGIESAADADYFHFDLESAADVAIFTTGANTRGQLLGRTGGFLASDSSSGAYDNFLIREHLQPGRYYVRVDGDRGPYMIHTVQGEAVRFADANLSSLIIGALGDLGRDGATSSELATLTGTLDAGPRGISDLGGLEFLVNLANLDLHRNRIRDVSALSSLVGLSRLDLERNAVADIAPLVANPGLGAGDHVFLGGNRLSADAVETAIPTLEARGVFVGYVDDHGNTMDAGAALLPLGTGTSASIYPANDTDVFRLRIGATTDVAIRAAGALDTVGVLYDAQGRQLATNDNTGARKNFMIARTLVPGDYYIQVRGVDATVRGAYVVVAHEDPNAAVLPDLNLRAAIADGLNKPPEAEIASVDLAAMRSLSAAGLGIQDLTGLELAVNLTHVDLDDNLVADIDPLADLSALAQLRLMGNRVVDIGPLVMNAGLGPGDRVYLQRNPLSGRAADMDIRELIDRGVAVAFADDHANRRAGATLLPLGGRRSGWIHRESDQDYFRLDLASVTDVAIFTTSNVDLLGTLSDRRGVQVAAGDDEGWGANFFLRATLAAGDYYLNVGGYDDTVGPYVVHAIRDPRVEIPDDRLRVSIEGVFYAAAGAPITTGDLASLQAFDAPSARIESLAGLSAAVNLRHLVLRHNRFEDVSALSGMTELAGLDLEGNDILDISALIENTGLGEGDKVVLAGNPLGDTALDAQLPLLEERGVFVGFFDDHGDSAGPATTLLAGGTAAGALSTVDDVDVFRLDLPDVADVVLYTTGSTNTRGRLSGAGARRLLTNDDGRVGRNFMIRRRLESGVHYVAVTGSGRGLEGVGPYMFHVEVAPTAAPTNIMVLRTGNSMVVTWDPVPSDASGGAITRYVVVATPSDGGSPHTCEAGPDANGCTLEGLEDDAEYVVTVEAVNAVGFGPVGTVAPTPVTAAPPLTPFWRGWRLALAETPTASRPDE